jgi:outer membrane protein assembly factor BamB
MRWLAPLLAALVTTGCGFLGFGDDDSGPQPAELTAIETTLPVARQWSADCGAGSGETGLALSLALDGQRIYCADHEDAVSAFALADGKRAWRVDTELPISGGPGVGAGRVVVGTADAQVAALAADDGHELWRARVSSEVLAKPGVGAGVTVVHSADGRLAAHEAGSGQRLWFVDSSVPALSLRGSSPPLIAGDQVMTGFANGKLAAYALQDGRQLWEMAVAIPRGRSELDRMVDIDAAPVLRGDTVYAVAYQGRVAAVARQSGTLLWSREFSSSSGLDVSAGRIYISDAQSHLWALDSGGGAAYWRQESLQYRRLSAPVAVADAVVVGDLEGYLHFFAAGDGRPVARVKVGDGPILTPPLVRGEMVYALSADGSLVAVKVGSE